MAEVIKTEFHLIFTLEEIKYLTQLTGSFSQNEIGERLGKRIAESSINRKLFDVFNKLVS